MAREKAAKIRPARKENRAGFEASMLDVNDGRGGHARSQARKTAVKKAFGLLKGKR